MREIIIARYCDLHYHWEDRATVEAEIEYRALQADGQLRVLDLCEPCSRTRLPLAELMELFAEVGTPEALVADKPPASHDRSFACRYPGCPKPGPFTKTGRGTHESRVHGKLYEDT